MQSILDEKKTLQPGDPPEYSRGEEIANSISHGVGALLSVAGMAVLVVLSSLHGEARHIVACAIYGSTMITLYTASTLYHVARKPSIKKALRVFDHVSIYLLIAGTYTPFSLVSLQGAWGWTLFGLVWGIAAIGIVFKLFYTGRFPRISTIIYIAMGWLAVIAIKPLIDNVPMGGLALILAGGLAYTGGVIFYAWKSLPYSHAIWHLFVVGGSVCHFLCVLFYVVP